MTKPGEFMDSEYSFDVSFDADVLGQQASAPATTRSTRWPPPPAPKIPKPD